MTETCTYLYLILILIKSEVPIPSLVRGHYWRMSFLLFAIENSVNLNSIPPFSVPRKNNEFPYLKCTESPRTSPIHRTVSSIWLLYVLTLGLTRRSTIRIVKGKKKKNPTIYCNIQKWCMLYYKTEHIYVSHYNLDRLLVYVRECTNSKKTPLS